MDLKLSEVHSSKMSVDLKHDSNWEKATDTQLTANVALNECLFLDSRLIKVS